MAFVDLHVFLNWKWWHILFDIMSWGKHNLPVMLPRCKPTYEDLTLAAPSNDSCSDCFVCKIDIDLQVLVLNSVAEIMLSHYTPCVYFAAKGCLSYKAKTLQCTFMDHCDGKVARFYCWAYERPKYKINLKNEG